MSDGLEMTAAQCIAGEWRAGRSTQRQAVVDPATGRALTHYAAASADDVQEAVQAAAAGFDAWRRRTALERAQALRRGAARLRERADTIARRLTAEQGKTLGEARREVEMAAEAIEWNADEGRRAYGRVIPPRMPGVHLHTECVPVGPVLAITPWNFPVMLSAMKVSAALAAGCAVILKPADETPGAAGELVRCLHEGGVAAEALQLLAGNAPEVCAALIAAEPIRKISFTGSTAVGRLLAELAGRHLKPMTLELGGHAPAIVCADADVEAAARGLSAVKYRNAGQICTNPSRFFVHRSVAGPFTEAMAALARAQVVGPGTADGVTMGPLANARRFDAVQALVEDARARGAHVASGGGRVGDAGFFYAPTVLGDVPDAARVMREEPFGPLVPITPFDSLDEDVARANALPYGLAAFCYTRGLATARQLADALKAGVIGINSLAVMQPESPFGGVADSGYGRENGSEGVAAYLHLRAITTAH